MYSQYCTKPFFKKPASYFLKHSAKGSTWKDHKYIKRIDGTYYYPENYAGGRHLSDRNKESEGEEKELTDEEKKAQLQKEKTRVFEEFNSVLLQKAEKGEFEYDVEKIASMSKEELGSLYKDITGTELGDRDLTRLFNSREAIKNPDSEDYEPMLSSGDLDKLARDVIKGAFGGVEDQKELLGENYADVLARVGEISMQTKSKKVSSASPEQMKKAEEVVEKAADKSTKSKITPLDKRPKVDREKVMSVYEKLRKRQK